MLGKYNKNDLKLLLLLYKEDCTSEARGLSKGNLTTQLEISASKLNQLLPIMIDDKLIQNGLKIGKLKTYFITNEGIELLESLEN